MWIQKNTVMYRNKMYWNDNKKDTVGIREERRVENYLHVIYKRASLRECNTKV